MSDSDRTPSSPPSAPAASDASPSAAPPPAPPYPATAQLELTDPELRRVYADVRRGAVVCLGSPGANPPRGHVELYSVLLAKLRVADAELDPSREALPELMPSDVASDLRPQPAHPPSLFSGVSSETHCCCGEPWDTVTEDYAAARAGESPRRVQVTCLAGHDAIGQLDRFGIVGIPVLAEDAVLEGGAPARRYSPAERDLLRRAIERERHEAALARLRGERGGRHEELAARLLERL